MVQIMARRRPGDKPSSEPMMFSLLTHICVTRPQRVKHFDVDIMINFSWHLSKSISVGIYPYLKMFVWSGSWELVKMIIRRVSPDAYASLGNVNIQIMNYIYHMLCLDDCWNLCNTLTTSNNKTQWSARSHASESMVGTSIAIKWVLNTCKTVLRFWGSNVSVRYVWDIISHKSLLV